MAPRELSPGVLDLTDPNLRPVRPERPQVSRGPDGDRVATDAGEHVRYLSRVSDEVGIADPVGERFAAVVGQWDELHEAAERWRRTADALERAAGDVGGKLGGIDAAWEGADADAFLAHMQEVGLAGNDVVDAMRALADALDHTAEAIRVLAQEFADVVRDAADSVSAAMMMPFDGESRVRQHLQDLDAPARELFEAAEDVVRAFVEFCEDFDAGRGVETVALDGGRGSAPDGGLKNERPTESAPAPPAAPEEHGGSAAASAGDAPAAGGAAGASSADAGGGAPASQLAEGGTSRAQEPSDTPAAGAAPGTSAAPAAAAAGGGVAGGGMMGMMPMGGMMGQNQQGQARQNSSRIKASPEELFGKPEPTAPAVFGANPKKPKSPDSDK